MSASLKAIVTFAIWPDVNANLSSQHPHFLFSHSTPKMNSHSWKDKDIEKEERKDKDIEREERKSEKEKGKRKRADVSPTFHMSSQ